MYETTHRLHFTDNKLTSGQRTVRDFSRELTKLQNSYNSAIQRRDDAKKELAKEHNSQQLQRWEIQHLAKREKDYKEQLDKIHLEIVGLKSHMPMLGENFVFPSMSSSLFWVENMCFLSFFWQRRAAGVVYQGGFSSAQSVTIYLC